MANNICMDGIRGIYSLHLLPSGHYAMSCRGVRIERSGACSFPAPARAGPAYRREGERVFDDEDAGGLFDIYVQ